MSRYIYKTLDKSLSFMHLGHKFVLEAYGGIENGGIEICRLVDSPNPELIGRTVCFARGISVNSKYVHGYFIPNGKKKPTPYLPGDPCFFSFVNITHLTIKALIT